MKPYIWRKRGIEYRDGIKSKSFEAGTVHVSFGLMTNGRQDA